MSIYLIFHTFFVAEFQKTLSELILSDQNCKNSEFAVTLKTNIYKSIKCRRNFWLRRKTSRNASLSRQVEGWWLFYGSSLLSNYSSSKNVALSKQFTNEIVKTFTLYRQICLDQTTKCWSCTAYTSKRRWVTWTPNAQALSPWISPARPNGMPGVETRVSHK